MSWVLVGAGTFQVVSGAMQAETMRESGKLSKEVADMNAEFAEVDAFNAIADGETKSAQYEGQVEQVLSAQRAEYAAKDVDVTFGSAAEVVADTKLAGFLNVLDIKNQARAQALGYKNQASQLRIGGQNASTQANLNASATQNAALIGGATTAGTAVAGYYKEKGGKK